jgi:WD40 repeat protein
VLHQQPSPAGSTTWPAGSGALPRTTALEDTFMFRWLVSCVLLCSLTVGVVYLFTDPLHLLGSQSLTHRDPQIPTNPAAKAPVEQHLVSANDDVNIVVFPENDLTSRLEPAIVPGGTVVAINKEEVPSERPGRVLFVARGVRPDEVDIKQIQPLATSTSKYFSDILHYIAIRTAPPGGDPSAPQSRPWHLGEDLDSDRVFVAPETRYFRELGVGDSVKKGELLMTINPILALDDLDIKQQKMVVARAEIETSVKTKEEAQNRYESMIAANKRVRDAYSQEDVRGGKLTWDRYIQEEIAKRAAYKQAQREYNASITQFGMHEIRAQISGVVKTIYKNKGDAVKELDPVMQIQDLEHVRVEGLLDAQDVGKVAVGETVYIEPAIAESPRKIMSGHLQAVTCVGVTNATKPIILSGSEDRTVRAWDPVTGVQKIKFEHKAAVRSLACTGKGVEANLAIVGCADGSARIFDLENYKKKCELPQSHTRSVTTVAFSPNGKLCATGSEDNSICVYDTESGKLAEKISHAHKSGVTSVQFATDDTFVSAGHDNVLKLWKKNQSWVPVYTHDKRSGDVTRPGVSADGKFVLVDDGKNLSIVSLEDKELVGSIKNTAGAGFRGLALFAPDDKTILTTSASDSRLQLWRAPNLEGKAGDDPVGRRAAELRQFAWSGGKEDAAAYAPDSSFIVSGTQDNLVLLWAMPDKKQIEERLAARVSLVEKSLDASSRQVRIWADVDNTSGWLTPGGTATIVIPPKK